jgi:secreted trypsin-like serine protease
MRRFAALAAFLFVSCACAGSAGAVVYGSPDGDAHPYVGVVRFWDASGRYLQRCSGTMLSPRVFLTAAHCTAGAASARVWLTSTAPSISDVNAGVGDPGHAGTPYTNPGWVGLVPPNTHDVGVVVLDAPVSGLSTFGQLPAAGQFDGLATQRGLQNQLFTVVGYGLQGVTPRYLELVQRYAGTAMFVADSSPFTAGYNFQLSSDPGAAHSGGACFGDSGGPVFYGTSNLIAGVNSFLRGDNCVGSNFAHRVDLADENAWIRSFLR